MSPSLFQQLPTGSRVLFIRLRNLGEAVLDTANLRALAEFRPDLEIYTLVEAIYTDLYQADPSIKAIPLTRGAASKRSSLTSRLAVIRDIRRHKFTAVVNLHGGPTSAQLCFASGAKYKVGASHFRNGYAYNLRVPPAPEILGREHLHTVETQFAWFKWLGLPGEQPGPTRVFPIPEAQRHIAGLCGDSPYAVIAPTNEFYTKRWLPDRYAAIGDYLISRGYKVVLSGAPTDEQRKQVAEVRGAMQGEALCLNDLNIGQLTALIAGAGVFAGNDSGPAHIAAAVRTPLVVLFGPASAERWRPWADKRARLVQNNFACNPCAMYTCTEYAEPECIRSISIEQVRQAIDEVTDKI